LLDAKEINDERDQPSEYVVHKQAYRDAAMKEGGWANSNLRTQLTKILKRAGIEPWKRLFHSMRASRQTELEREHPLHVVCSWLGNTESVAKKSYLLVCESDYLKASQIGDPKSGTIRGTIQSHPPPKTKGKRHDLRHRNGRQLLATADQKGRKRLVYWHFFMGKARFRSGG
jgi:hypothetical protein